MKQIAGFFVYDRSGNHHDMAFTIARFNFMLKNIKKNAKAKITSWDPKTTRKPKIMDFGVFDLFLDPSQRFSP